MKIPTIGDYPDCYKPEVHGPYDPAVYYGKPDTPFGQVKLCDLKSWFGRRSYNPRAVMGLLSRYHHRWAHKYLTVKKPNGVFFLQIIFLLGTFTYIGNFRKKMVHRHCKYH